MASYSGHFQHTQCQPQQQNCEPILPNNESSKAKNIPNSSKVGGSYGVSIRVQGIDGHPYIVLNNTEGDSPESFLASENGQPVTSLTLNRAVPDSSSAPEHDGRNGEECLECHHASPGLLPSLKLTSTGKGEKKEACFSPGAPQSSSLLNFQRHPELLQPYNPEKNLLNLDTFQTSSFHKSKSVADEERPEAKSQSSLLKPISVGKTCLQFAELAKANVKTVNLSNAAPVEDINKLELESNSISDCPNGTHESLSPSGGSACAVSPTTCQNTRKSQPDLLPFRRQDSAGSIPNGSRRSSTSSTTPTSAASLYRFFLDDQECAIYADHVNRHENRRYIPFLPGTGRDIDTGSIPAVDQLIEKFDKKASHPRRGRLGMRSRIHPDDRKRSRSVDSLLPSGLQVNLEGSGEFSQDSGKLSEHLLQPSQMHLKKPVPRNQKSPSPGEQSSPRTVGKLQATARDADSGCFNSLQSPPQANITDVSVTCKASTLPVQTNKNETKTMTSTLLIANRTATLPDLGAKKVSAQSFASASNAQVIGSNAQS